MVHESAWVFFGMHVFWWLLWLVVILTLVSTVVPIPKSQLRSGETAMDILRRRYAAGLITSDEYEERRRILERDEMDAGPVSSPARAHQH